MTREEYIEKMNELYTERHNELLFLVYTVEDGTYPYAIDGDPLDPPINVQESLEKLDKEIFNTVLAASKEPWYDLYRFGFIASNLHFTFTPGERLFNEFQPKPTVSAKDFKDFTF
jgi:hypothetical protein